MFEKIKKERAWKKHIKKLQESIQRDQLRLQESMDDLRQSTEIESIEEIERRTFYDVTFNVKFKDGGECKVTLAEERRMEDLLSMIKKLKEVTPDTIRSLDERHKIYYD